MAHQRINREQEYALYEIDDCSKSRNHGEDSLSARRASRYGKDVLAPPEEHRRANRDEKKLNVQHATGQSKHILWENIFLLTLLVIFIYVLYRLTIYLLNQA